MPSETSGRVFAKFPAARIAAPDFELNVHSKFPGRARYPILCCYRTRSLHFLNHLFEIIRHFRQGSSRTFILPSSPRQMMVFTLREPRILFGIIFAKLGTTTLLSFERRPRYCFGNSQQVFKSRAVCHPGLNSRLPLTPTWLARSQNFLRYSS